MEFKNAFLYIALFLLSVGITVFVERKLIKHLSGKASQPIYSEGPSWHAKKSGTPTMGGLAFLPASLLCLVFSFFYVIIFPQQSSMFISVIITLIYAIANSLVGIFDDLTKLKRKENAGLTPFQKLFLQFLLAVIFLMARAFYLEDDTTIDFSFGKIDFGFLYYPLVIIILLGIVNCANLTDGIDGLASSVAFAIGIVFFLISSNPDTTLISLILSGVALGFLFFNLNPARIFMGDTGSLFLGAMGASLSFSLKNPFLILFIGGVYVIEGVSVILQVIYFKATRKRLFKMAPLHHHLEKSGFSENRICLIAVLLTLALSLIAGIL